MNNPIQWLLGEKPLELGKDWPQIEMSKQLDIDYEDMETTIQVHKEIEKDLEEKTIEDVLEDTHREDCNGCALCEI